MGSGTLLQNSMGSAESIEPMLTQPLIKNYFLTCFLQSQICYVACGAEHTVCLTEDGGVFSFGSGQYGQLGHGSKSDEQNPRQIIELMGTEVSQIACGKKHTLAFVPTRGRVYAFGLGGSGQLGNSAYGSSTTPQGIFFSSNFDCSQSTGPPLEGCKRCNCTP